MQTSSLMTNHKCAHGPCGCDVGPAERYCSDHCEDHGRAPREDGAVGHSAGACGCGHPECDSPGQDPRG